VSKRDDNWWEADEDGSHDLVTDLVDRLRDQDSVRLQRIRIHQDIYDGRNLDGISDDPALRGHLSDAGMAHGQLNFTRAAVDYLHAKITVQRPAVKCASRGGDWTQTLRARKLTRFLEAQADALCLDVKGPLAVHMALQTGSGIIKTSAVNGKVEMDNVPSDELFVDPGEARYGSPQHMYQIRAVPRLALIVDFPDNAGDIDDAPDSKERRLRNITDDSDLVDVYEAWSLPTEDVEGRHVVCVHGATLVDEPWEHTRFPFARIDYHPARAGDGYYGQGLVERLLPVQWEIDGLVGQINMALRIGARFKVFVQKDSGINIDHLADPDMGTVIEYVGQLPTFMTPEPVPRELFEHLRFMIEQLYSQAGMSQEAATSMKPAGLSSGVALLHYHDFQTQRHIDVVRRYAAFVLEIANLLIDRAKDLAAEDGDWEADYAKGSVIRTLKWTEVDMERDQFVMELETVSPVPESYAGRLQLIEQFSQSGQIPPEYLGSLISDPDMVRVNRLLTANADYIEHVIEIILDPEKEIPLVRDEQNLQMTLDIVKAAMMDAIVEEAPDEVIDRFEGYLQDVVERMKALTPPAPPMMPPPPGMPPA